MTSPEDWAAFGTLLSQLPDQTIGIWSLSEGIDGGYRVVLYWGRREKARWRAAYSTEGDAFSPTGHGGTPQAALQDACTRWCVETRSLALSDEAKAFWRLEVAMHDAAEARK
jgi:hypothetical protein